MPKQNDLTTKEGFVAWYQADPETNKTVLESYLSEYDFDPKKYSDDESMLTDAFELFKKWMNSQAPKAETTETAPATEEAPAPKEAESDAEVVAGTISADDVEEAPVKAEQENSLVTVVMPIKDINLTKGNIRTVTDATGIEWLAASIGLHGIIEPVVIDQDYNLIAGYRRIMAAKEAGLTEAPVVVRQTSDKERFAIQVAENLDREDLSPVDKLRAIRQAKNLGYNNREIGPMFQIHENTVSNYLNVTDPETGVWPKTLDFINTNKREAYSISAIAEMANMGNDALYEYVTGEGADKGKVTAKDLKEKVAGIIDEEKPTKEPEFEADEFGTDEGAIGRATKVAVMTHINQLNAMLPNDELELDSDDIESINTLSEKLIELINTAS